MCRCGALLRSRCHRRALWRHASADRKDKPEKTEPIDANDPREPIENELPTEPIEQNDATEPIENELPTEPIEQYEPIDAIERPCSSRCSKVSSTLGASTLTAWSGGRESLITASLREVVERRLTSRVVAPPSERDVLRQWRFRAIVDVDVSSRYLVPRRITGGPGDSSDAVSALRCPTSRTCD